MNRESIRAFITRYSSAVVLIAIGLGVVLMGRSTVVAALFSADSEPIAMPAVDLEAAAATVIEPVVTPQPDTSGDQSAQFFDLSGVPTLIDSRIVPQQDPTTYEGILPEHNYETYVVERGDIPVKIAERFGIKPETLLGGNPRLSEEAGLLQVGDELLILPIDGVLHDVRPGDTLESISALYGIPIEDIIAYENNNLEFPFRLYADTKIMVPGAVRDVFKWDPPPLPSLVSGGGYWAGQAQPLIVGTGTFVWPVGSRNLSQSYWYAHQAIDVAVVEGTPVVASDTGTVTYAAWSPHCYGNLIVVNHGNGNETFYAHLSGFNVVPGQIVYQGNVIGYTGNTGCSSGPHVHFEIRVWGTRDDPMWWLP